MEKRNIYLLNSQLNWRQKLSGADLNSVLEARLYTDATIRGEENLGPYAFLNTLADIGTHRSDLLRRAIALRLFDYEYPPDHVMPLRPIADSQPPRFETADAHYHGGDALDEIAALVALFLGARVKAGPIDRRFNGESDRYGRPVEHETKLRPQLPAIGSTSQIPQLTGEKNLGSMKILEKYPYLSAEHAAAVVKIARLYQQATWLSDTDASLAWLLLVSAVEVAAVVEAKETVSEEDLVAAMPKLASFFKRENLVYLLAPLSLVLSEYVKATARFADFLVRFCPPAPSKRPQEFLRISFEPDAVRKAARLIYRYRSNALHDGRSFPAPMCVGARTMSFGGKPDDACWEVPAGLAMSVGHAVWDRADTPMVLHMFEYIARNALLKWFEALPRAWNPEMAVDSI